jgi:TldD protein
LSPLSANAFLPEPLAPLDLKALATSALDAARQVGASYADVRIAEWNELQLYPFGLESATSVRSRFGFGLRVLVEGTWAFVHGNRPLLDDITAAARNAVATARGYSHQTTRRVELVPTPPATGEWATPFAIDPFTVPLQDQSALLYAFMAAADRVRYGEGDEMRFRWTRETRVFASTEGTLTTQTLRSSDPVLSVVADCGLGFAGRGRVYGNLPQIRKVAGGYETLTVPGLQEALKRLTEDTVRLASLPRGTLDVGRYPVVFDGATLGMVLANTVGVALEMDRVLGYEADASGTSFLKPPQDVLGTQIVSPLLTVTGNRALPTASAVQWDDEGVAPREVPVIRGGVLVDYFSSRQTAENLRPWYERQGQRLQSNGCAVASQVSDPVSVRAPSLTVSPDATAAMLEDLCKDIKRGILVLEAPGLSTDQELASGSFVTRGIATEGIWLEIQRGQPVRRLHGNGIQFSTRKLWKSLLALGDARTVCDRTFELYKGQPWHPATQSVSAPAGLLKDIDVFAFPLFI